VISAGNLGTNQVVIRRHAGGDGRESALRRLRHRRVSGASSSATGRATCWPHWTGFSPTGPSWNDRKLDPLTGFEMWRSRSPGARFYAIAADASGTPPRSG
jgi:hypothetical protein